MVSPRVCSENCSAVARNREEAASTVIWRHNQWGQSESWQKELTIAMRVEQISCGEFEANAISFSIGVLAYNLAERLKRQVLPETGSPGGGGTLQWKSYQLAGKWVRHARGCALQIKADLEKWRLFASMMGWTRALSLPAG